MMNTRADACQQIDQFRVSDRRFLLLTGTHLQEKYVLVLQRLLSHPISVLFRIGHLRIVGELLRPVLGSEAAIPRSRKINLASGASLYVDSHNHRSWANSPKQINEAVLYLIGSLDHGAAHRSIKDVLDRGATRVYLVTWADNRDIRWVEEFDPVRVTYDAASERPGVHAEVKAICAASEWSEWVRLGQRRPSMS